MNKETREAIQALLSQVEDLLELNYWYGSGDDQYQAQEEARAKQATRLVARYLYQEEAKVACLKYANEQEREARKEGKRIVNKADYVKRLTASVMDTYDRDKADN